MLLAANNHTPPPSSTIHCSAIVYLYFLVFVLCFYAYLYRQIAICFHIFTSIYFHIFSFQYRIIYSYSCILYFCSNVQRRSSIIENIDGGRQFRSKQGQPDTGYLLVTDYLLYENIDNIAAAFYGQTCCTCWQEIFSQIFFSKRYLAEYFFYLNFIQAPIALLGLSSSWLYGKKSLAIQTVAIKATDYQLSSFWLSSYAWLYSHILFEKILVIQPEISDYIARNFWLHIQNLLAIQQDG